MTNTDQHSKQRSLRERIFSRKAPPKQILRQDVTQILANLEIDGCDLNLSEDRFIDTLSVENNMVRVVLLLPNDMKEHSNSIRVEAIKALGSLINIAGLHVQVKTRPDPKPQAKKRGALDGVRNIIAVASGKGGVGKSSCSVNLAHALKQTGAKVGLLDADVYGPSLVMMTNVGEPEYVRDGQLIPPEKDGIKVISSAMFQKTGAAVMRGPMATQLIQQFINNVDWGDLDVLIIDFPPGTGDVQITLSQQARISGAVIVTTPQDVALLDARKAMEMFKTVNIPIIGVVENMSYFACGHKDKKHYIFGEGGGRRLAEEYDVPLIAEIPIDETMPLSSDTGKAVVKILPDSKSAREFSKAAISIATETSRLNKFKPFAFDWK